LNTLGDHLQKRRLDLGVQWKDVAEQIGASATNVALWRAGRTAPGLRLWPGIIRFLGYDPRPKATTIGDQLKRHREGQGVTQKELARHLGVDPATLAGWERGERQPAGRLLTLLQAVVGDESDKGELIGVLFRSLGN
jgi:transcriptional regulator with XRE-family HTH domain